jgi:FkbM family methyltransferase
MMVPPSAFENFLVWYARAFPLRRGKLRIVEALWRLAGDKADTQRTASLLYGGFKMPCDIRQMLQRQYYFFGTYFLEAELLDCWQTAARGARMIFDVGANAGIYSLAALAAAPAATVHAFEVTPELAEKLRETAALNGLAQLHVHQAAVSDKSGTVFLNFFRGDDGMNEGMNYITEGPRTPGAIRVPAINIDAFCAARGIEHIDLLKLDVQGQEHLVLNGAIQLISAGRIGSIFTELNWATVNNVKSPAEAVIALLCQAGYSFAKPGSRLIWRGAGDWMRNLSDMVARRPKV